MEDELEWDLAASLRNVYEPFGIAARYVPKFEFIDHGRVYCRYTVNEFLSPNPIPRFGTGVLGSLAVRGFGLLSSFASVRCCAASSVVEAAAEGLVR